jgi:Effector-associated domain 5
MGARGRRARARGGVVVRVGVCLKVGEGAEEEDASLSGAARAGSASIKSRRASVQRVVVGPPARFVAVCRLGSHGIDGRGGVDDHLLRRETMGLLSHDEILKLHACVVSAGLVESGPALLAGIDGPFVAGLPRGASPSDQLLRDLGGLNAVPALADRSVPLSIWLANAIQLAGSRVEATTFREARARLGQTLAREPHDSTTPTASLVATPAAQTTYLTGSVHLPLWRRVRVRDELRFNPPADGFLDGGTGTRVFHLGPGAGDRLLGRAADHNGHKNALVLPHASVSQQCLLLKTSEGRTVLHRLPECRAPVTVGLHPLECGEPRAVYHGQVVSIGKVSGVFVDGRYTQAQVSAHAVDPMTGLLGRDGIALEIALALRAGDPPDLLFLQPKGEALPSERVAARVALALHSALPSHRIARLDACVALMLAPGDILDLLLALAGREAGAPLLAGRYRLDAVPPREAAARVEEARAALERTGALAAPGEVLDLNRHALALLDVPPFERAAAAFLARGGELVLVALAERERLEQLETGVCDALALEVLKMLGRTAGPSAILAQPLPGVIACAAPAALEAAAHELAASFRALGPVCGENIEIERGICVEVVRAPDAVEVMRRARDLASGPSLRIEALPAPLALRVRAALSATSLYDVALTLVDLVRETFRFAAVALTSMLVRSAQSLPPPSASGDVETWPWLDPWQACAAQAAATLTHAPGRPGALASAWFDHDGAAHDGLAAAVRVASFLRDGLERRPIDMGLLTRGASNARPALDNLVTALGALRGWALVAVERVDRLDEDRDAETVTYRDYTGSFELGAPRRVTLLSGKRISPVVYLARFAEGIVVPLDPFARRRLCPTCGAEELFFAEEFIATPGRHTYRSVHRGHTLDDEVRLRDIPAALRGAPT